MLQLPGEHREGVSYEVSVNWISFGCQITDLKCVCVCALTPYWMCVLVVGLGGSNSSLLFFIN